MHDYQRDPQSGAGNCTCGAAESHRWHPHAFRRISPQYGMATILSTGSLDTCVCGMLAEARQHLAVLTTSTQ